MFPQTVKENEDLAMIHTFKSIPDNQPQTAHFIQA